MVTITISDAINNAIQWLSDDTMSFVTIQLSNKYNFNPEEAIEYLINCQINAPSLCVRKKMKTSGLYKEGRFHCPDCPKTYASQGGLKQHIDVMHPTANSKPKYACQYCNKNHYNSCNLNRHTLSCIHNPKRITPSEGKFICVECANNNIHKAFKQKGNLQTHRKKIHKCAMC